MDNNIQTKKNNLKIIIPDNSNDDLEPSTSGSKLSQNTPSNSPLINIEKNKIKNEEKKIISLNKNDTNIIEDEELFKVTPHFLNDNMTSCESLKEQNILNRPLVPNNDSSKKIKPPLTCDERRFVNYKFNFNFETNENGVIIPKEKTKEEEKKVKKLSNIFRIGNKNNENKNKILNINKQNYSNNKIYSKKESQQQDKKPQSPLNSSLISLKYNMNESPINSLKNKEEKKYDNLRNYSNNKNKKAIIENKKRMYTSRPNSVKNITSKYRSNNPNNTKINEMKKDKKNDINNTNNYHNNINQRKKYSNSVNKKVILPKLTDNNKNYNIKNYFKNEFVDLFKILPDNCDEFPEIKNNLGCILQNFNEIKEYINKKNNCNHCTYNTNKNFCEKQKK